MEILQVVSSDDEPLFGLERDQVVTQGLWRRASGGIIFSPDRRYALCHRRSTLKDERGGVWVATFGGKVLENENAEDAARRELREEFGLQWHEVDIKFFGRFRSEVRRQFEYVYSVVIPKKTNKIVAQQCEVEAWRWVDVEYLLTHMLLDRRWYIYGYEIALIESVIDN